MAALIVMDFNKGAIPVIDVKGIGPSYTNILERFGIRTTGDFLKDAQYPKDRHKLSKLTGIDEKRIAKWASICDLIRVEGIAETWSELLIELGVHNVQGLASEDFTNLWSRIDHHQLKKGDMIKKKPTKDNVKSWQSDAQALEPLLHMDEKARAKPVLIVEKKPKVVLETQKIELKKPMIVTESPMAENHVGMFEKAVIIASGVILISILVLNILVILNPALA